MPGKVKVRVLAARHLPVMDRSSENTDAFAEVRFGDYPPFKTEVCRKSLNPVWNSEVFRFEVADDLELQDEPLQVRVMDYDTYSANDAIGKVYIDLNPLLLKRSFAGAASGASATGTTGTGYARRNTAGNIGLSHHEGGGDHQPVVVQQHQVQHHKAGGSMMTGWLPIYDTMHGIRGEVNVLVKVELFSDFNKFRQSSCGVPFFCSAGVPEGFTAQCINGFVEELVVNDDPEYQWIDKIRTPRASNEARQLLFLKLSGAVQRKIGLKALELGGNAVVGYQQKFDLEGDTGIVVRGVGTAMLLARTDANATAAPSGVGAHSLSAPSFKPDSVYGQSRFSPSAFSSSSAELLFFNFPPPPPPSSSPCPLFPHHQFHDPSDGVGALISAVTRPIGGRSARSVSLAATEAAKKQANKELSVKRNASLKSPCKPDKAKKEEYYLNKKEARSVPSFGVSFTLDKEDAAEAKREERQDTTEGDGDGHKPKFFLEQSSMDDDEEEDDGEERRKSSVDTNEVTLINTIINKSLVTVEGEAIRKQLSVAEEGATTTSKPCKKDDDDDDSLLPPALCVEPPTPVPYSSAGSSPEQQQARKKKDGPPGFPLQRTRHRSDTTNSSGSQELLLDEEEEGTRIEKRRIWARTSSRVRSVSEGETASSSSSSAGFVVDGV